jgi:hypothetical protein
MIVSHYNELYALIEKSGMVKLLRAYGGCLGVRRRRKTWMAAISLGELSNEL